MNITIEQLKRIAKDIKDDFKADVNDSHSGAEAFGASLALRTLIGHLEELQKEEIVLNYIRSKEDAS